MSDINQINKFLIDILNPDIYPDIALNGIQVECNSPVKKISFAVDASRSSIEACVKNNSDLLIVHHGFFWGKQIAVTGVFRERIKMLLDNNIGVIAYHLPLDLHKEYGNNARILKQINSKKNELFPFGFYHGTKIGFMTELDDALSIENILNDLIINNSPYKYLDFGNKKIKKIGAVSGGGDFAFDEAVKNGLDLFITGDSSHVLYHLAKEYKINVLFAGHYFTETFGIKALMDPLKNHFKIDAEFLNIPTEL